MRLMSLNGITDISLIDISIITLYLVGIIWWGLRNAKNKSSKDYFLAGRNMGWAMVGLALFSASISTSTLIGHSGATYKYGLVIFNYNLISVLVMIFFAWIFLPFYIKSGIYTMPEFLERRFDSRSKFYFSSISIVGGVFMDIAATLYGSAMIFSIIFPDISIRTVVIISALIVASYTIPGGLASVIKTEVVQAVILIIGSMILAFLAWHNVGSWQGLAERLADSDKLHLIRGLNDEAVPWPAMIVAIPILGFYFWGNNQQLVQRVLSAKSVDSGRKGVLLTGFLTMFTLYLIFIPALRAFIAFPDTSPADGIYPRMVTTWLPVGLLGIMLAAMISALTASLSGCLNSLSTLFTMDFYRRFNPKADSKKLVRVGQISATVILTLGAIWAPFIEKFGTLVNYYQQLLSYVGPPIVAAFMLGLFWKRANATGVFAGLMSTIAIALFMMMYGLKHTFLGDIHFLYMAPINFTVTLIIMIVVSLLTGSPPEEKTKGMTLTRAFFREEATSLRGVRWYKDFRFWSVMLVLFCLVILFIYK
ncbi:MAG: sodium:solute symporter [Bacteroidales bacterium]|jgi:SSS family solute:Na+ symporter|nr:sodium:solute symporter [Bacteroidales bacterium]